MSANAQLLGQNGTRSREILGRVPSDVTDRMAKIEEAGIGIRRMYEQGRYSVDVLDQITAATQRRTRHRACGVCALG